MRFGFVVGATVYVLLMLVGSVTGGLFTENKTAISVLGMVLLGSCLVCGLSLRYRVRRRSTKLGIAALAAGLVCLAVSFLGMLTVGPFVLPVALAEILAALPLEKMYA